MDELVFKEDHENIKIFLKQEKFLSLKYKNNLQAWRCKLLFQSYHFFFDIVYHSLYPALPPKVFCYTDEKYNQLSIDKFWKGRILPDFSVCLFPMDSGESAWRDSYRIDMVLKKFKNYIQLKLEEKIPEEHTSINFKLEDYAVNEKYYLNPRIYERIYDFNIDLIYYHAFSIESFSTLPFQTIYGYFIDEKSQKFNELRKRPVKIIKLTDKEFNSFLQNIVSHKAENVEFLLKSDKIYIKSNLSEDLLICHQNKNKFPIIFFHWNRNFKLKNYFYSIIDSKQGFYDLLYKRQKSLDESHFSTLKNIKIILIGLGSLGSKIYEELIHNGIQKIILYDPDIYKPENVMRSFTPLPYLGLPKTFAIKEYTHFLSPKVQVWAYHGSPFNPMLREKFFNHLSEADLVISSIDHEIDEYELNHACLENNIPLIFGTCLKNARFGRVFRIRTDTPCLNCINHQIEVNPDQFPSMHSELVQDDYYHQPGIPGINLDIKEIANKVVRFAFQTLAEIKDLGNFFQPVKYDHFLVSNYQGWIFEEPGRFKIQNFYKWDECPICGQNDKS